jgi:UDP-3-O-acyl-N-acetylglucosamine deacetylase
LVFDDSGPLDNELRFADECARHKLLDMIGDFALSGCDLIGKFTASRSGHRLNSQMVFALLQQIVKTHPIRISA